MNPQTPDSKAAWKSCTHPRKMAVYLGMTFEDTVKIEWLWMAATDEQVREHLLTVTKFPEKALSTVRDYEHARLLCIAHLVTGFLRYEKLPNATRRYGVGEVALKSNEELTLQFNDGDLLIDPEMQTREY